jgi:hypothetical protein
VELPAKSMHVPTSQAGEIGGTPLFRSDSTSVDERLQLHAALEYVREGDVFVLAKLDRLANSVPDLMAILQASAKQPCIGFWPWIEPSILNRTFRPFVPNTPVGTWSRRSASVSRWTQAV